MHRIPLFFTATALFVVCLTQTGWASPKETVDQYHDRLLQTLEQTRDVSWQARFEAFAPLMDEAFDFETMVKTVAGASWRRADEAMQAKMLASFRRLSIALHARRFSELGKAQFAPGSVREGPRGLKLVDSKLSPAGETPVQLTYVVREKDGKAGIVDVLMKGTISELAVRVSEYRKILNEGGATAFVATMDKQTAGLLSD